jgi:glutaredoxin
MIPNLRILTLAVVFFLASCASSNKTSSSASGTPGASSPNDGSSFEKAIVVKSVSEEYAYVRKVCPECKFRKQALTSNNKKYYDVLYFIKAGSEVVYYFDINSFFGKGY